MDQPSQTKVALSPNTASILAQKLVPGVLAMIIGSFLVFGVGLANPAEIHNAAHDSRHSFSFPCH